MYRRLGVWKNDRMFGIHREVAYVLFYLSLSERFSSKNSSSQKSNSRAASIIHVSVKSSRITPSSIPQEEISVQKSREPTAVTIRSTRFFISIKIILSLSSRRNTVSVRLKFLMIEIIHLEQVHSVTNRYQSSSFYGQYIFQI